MARDNKIKLLFVPYQPKGSTASADSSPEYDADQNTSSHVSWQKHASTEYHRRNHLKKASLPASNSRDDRRARHHVRTSRLQPRVRRDDPEVDEDSRESEDSDFWSPVGDTISGQIDPFGVIIRSNMPEYAQKMFHHST